MPSGRVLVSSVVASGLKVLAYIGSCDIGVVFKESYRSKGPEEESSCAVNLLTAAMPLANLDSSMQDFDLTSGAGSSAVLVKSMSFEKRLFDRFLRFQTPGMFIHSSEPVYPVCLFARR